MKRNIELTLIAGARPDLLKTTIESLFKRTNIADLNVFLRCNVDKFGGDERDVETVKCILADYFPHRVVYTPRKNSFSLAVKRLWSGVHSSYVIHMEDDWVIREPIDFESLFNLIDQKVKCVSFATAEKNLRKRPKYHSKRKYKFLPSPFEGLLRKPVFTTSPSLYDGKVLNEIGGLLNPELDPEKQMYNGKNAQIEDYLSHYRNLLYYSSSGDYAIEDIGREWHSKNDIVKTVVDGVSTWDRKRD